MDAMEPESEHLDSEKSFDDAGDDAEVQMGDLAPADAPNKLFSAKAEITKGKGNRKWQQQQCTKKDRSYDTGRLIHGWQTGRVWLGLGNPLLDLRGRWMVKCRCCNNKQLASKLGTIVSHENSKEHKKNLPDWEAAQA